MAVLLTEMHRCAGGVHATQQICKRPHQIDKAEIEAALNAPIAKYKTLQEGANADYIPALARGRIFSVSRWSPPMAVMFTAGDVKSEVSIQSFPKSSPRPW
jgi:glutaminase